MKNSADLRMSFLNGYNKKDVQKYLEEMTHQVEEVRNEKERELATLKKKCTDLGLTNKALEDEKNALEQELEDYARRKDVLARVEVDAQIRADKLVAQAQLEIQRRQEEAQAQLEKIKARADAYIQERLAEGRVLMDQDYANHVKRSTAYRHEVQMTLQQSQTVIREMDVILSKYMELTQALKSGLMDLTAISNREILLDLPAMDSITPELEIEEIPVEEIPVEKIPMKEPVPEEIPVKDFSDSFSIPLEELPLEPPVDEAVPLMNRKPCKTVEEMFQQILEDEAKA